MRIVVHGHNVEMTPDIHSQVERRILRTLEDFGKRVGRVTVRLHVAVGGENAVTTCHILVELHPSGGLGIGETGSTLATAVDRAARRASDAVARELTRRTGLPECL